MAEQEFGGCLLLCPTCCASWIYIEDCLILFVLQLEDLKQFRQWGSKTPGHPENFETLGVEVTTGEFPNLCLRVAGGRPNNALTILEEMLGWDC